MPLAMNNLKRSLIDEERISEIGGLENPDIRRILTSFTSDLIGYLHLIDQQRQEKGTEELLATLHKLAGASRTCGFSGISRAVDAWTGSAKPFSPKLHADLRTVIEASIEEWHNLAS
jgi:HPt (histidine-containing phosphotransfer) domain-containing protein